MSSFTLDNPTAFTAAGTFTSFGGNFQGGGTVYLDGATSTISGNFSLYESLVNNSDLTTSNAAILLYTTDVTVTNNAIIDLEGGVGEVSGSGTLINDGTLLVTPTTNAFALDVYYQDTATSKIVVQGNAALFSFYSGGPPTYVATLNGSFSTTGTALLDFNGNFNFTSSSSINADRVQFDDGTVLEQGSYSVSDSTNLNGAQLTFSGDVTSLGLGILSVSNGTINFMTPALETVTTTNVTLVSATVSFNGNLLLDDSGDFTLDAASSLDISLGGPTSGAQFDQIDVGGAVSLNGVLNVSVGSGFVPEPGDSFTIVQGASVTGMFAGLPNGAIIEAAAGHFQIEYQGHTVNLDFLQAPSTTVIASSANPSEFGDSVTFTATVSSGTSNFATPTGTVDFYDTTTGQDSGQRHLSGQWRLDIEAANLAATSGDVITANYEGDTNFSGSSGTVTQVVNQASTKPP